MFIIKIIREIERYSLPITQMISDIQKHIHICTDINYCVTLHESIY